MSEDRILLVLPLPIYRLEDQFFIDTQAANNLGLWLDNFARVTLIGPEVALSEPRLSTSNVERIKNRARLTIVPVTAAWTSLKFLKALPSTARLLDEHMRRANYLHFAIGGLWGDWGAVASFIARWLKLPYAVWTDRVESKVATFSNLSRKGVKKFYHSVNIALMIVLEKSVIRGSSIGLFHGQDCFDAYARFSSNPQVVHDISTEQGDFISGSELVERFSRQDELRIAYAGRVHREKGVFDWINALANLTFPFRATWFGDGPEIDTAREMVQKLKLGDKIYFPGAFSHKEILHHLKRFDLFLFCHKTPESPRCLIEALQCGLPIVGYDSPYPRMLAAQSAGLLSKQDDIAMLVQTLSDINSDRTFLRSSSEAAAIEGTKYSAGKVFAHRSALMRTIPTRPQSN